MKTFSALLRLQLLSRWAALKPANLRASMQTERKKTLGKLIGYAVLVVYLAGFLIFFENAVLSALMEMNMADLLLDLAVMGAMVSTLILAFFFILSSLYFTRDNAFMASLPVKPRTLLAAKLTDVWLSEMAGSALFLLPAGLLYGIRMGQSPGFFLRLVLVLIGAPVIPVAIVAFLSTLLIRLSSLWKRREAMATVGGILFLGIYMFCCMRMGALMPDESQEFLASFFASNSARISALTRAFPPAAWAAGGLCGDWGQLALFLLSCAAAAGLTLWGVGAVYRKLSLLQSETPSVQHRVKGKASFQGKSAFRACLGLEWKRTIRTSAYATNTLPTALMPALMIAVMFFSIQSNMDEGESLQSILDGMNGGVMVAIFAALMAFLAGINPALSTAVTREGKGHSAMTALPVSSRTIIQAKMALGLGLSAAGCLIAAVILAIAIPALAVHVALALVICLLYAYLCGAIALSNDVANPNLDWLTETEAIKQKSGALVGLLVSWGILIALGGLSYLMLSAGMQMLPYSAILIALLLACSLAAHAWLMRTADRKYRQG